MSWLKKIAQIEIPFHLEAVFERAYNIHKEYFREEGIKSWREWVAKESPYELALVIESDSVLYDKYLRFLPEGVTTQDIIEAYKNGQLREVVQTTPVQPIPIEQTNIRGNLPWQHLEKLEIDPETAKRIYETARTRITKSNNQEVSEARKKIFLLFNTDPELSEKIGVKKAELNRYIKYLSGLSAKSRQLHETLNRGIPDEHQWIGICNSTFIGRSLIDPEELEQFVNKIEVTNEGKGFYGSSQGSLFRKYITGCFLSIDTHLSYKDLSLKIGKCETSRDHSPRGQYLSEKKMIVVSDVNEYTVAHELGHYLDYKFGEQFTGYRSPLSTVHYSFRDEVPIQQKQWGKNFNEFVNQLMDKGDIGSEYLQRPSEVFARFVAQFVAWTQNNAGYTTMRAYIGYFDRFKEQDFRLFVRMLQEKSYLDTRFPIPS